jgi:hypothetical protein
MGDHASESLAGEPRVQWRAWGSILKTFRPAWLELKNRLFAGYLCMLIFFRQRRAMSPEITTRSVRGDKRFSVSIKRARAAAVSTRP